ncbi:MAG: hypothetical protein A4E25_00312 [Methanobacterium sp. PtaB.Bin024]|jgi:hypothetical protein|nr:hypothetical protein [Methanobacteriaceae archaeon]OPX60638.1 MAG: hypothetical protein A4E25_00312 [Methanobacterium sp. PtaB.Bin024]OPY23785.1 MAG: hypothetical protein A4E26_00663 [Methanobacterium sp. PtaU1.Bin097]
MAKPDLEKICQEDLEKLIGKKIISVRFKSYNEDCWRMHIDTDQGRIVMTFCRDWPCPVVEYRKPK